MNSIVRKVAFVLDFGSEPKQLVKNVSLAFADGQWTPPFECTKGKNREYWRRLFLLVYRYICLGINIDGSREHSLPLPLIYKDQHDYYEWRLLAKYWLGKKYDIRDPLKKTPELRDLQMAVSGIFLASGATNTPRVLFDSDRDLEVVLCPSSKIELWPGHISGTSPLPPDFFERNRIDISAGLPLRLTTAAEQLLRFEGAQLNKVERRTECLIPYMSVLVFQGMARRIPLFLREVTARRSAATEDAVTDQEPREAINTIVTAIENGRCILVYGPSGSGKSCLLRSISRKLNESPGTRQKHVVVVELGAYAPSLHKTFEDLVFDSMQREIERTGDKLEPGEATELKNWLNSSDSRTKDTVYMLDGYSDVPFESRYGPGRFEDIAARFLRTIAGAVIVTSRGLQHPQCLTPSTYRLAEPEPNALIKYVRGRLENNPVARRVRQLFRDPQFFQLVTNMYYLDFIIEIAQHEPEWQEFTSSRANIIGKIVGFALEEMAFTNPAQMSPASPSLPDVEWLLSRLAYTSLQEPDGQLFYPESLSDMFPDVETRTSALQIAMKAGLIEHFDLDLPSLSERRIRFTNELYRDFFAARHVIRQIQQKPSTTSNQIVRLIEFHRCDEPLYLLAEMLGQDRHAFGIARAIATYDCVAAAAFAARGNLIDSDLLCSIVAGTARLHETWANQARTPPFFDLTTRHLNQNIVTLLSRYDTETLFESYVLSADHDWLRCHVLAALGRQGARVSDVLRERSFTQEPRDVFPLLLGLSDAGAIDEVRLGARLFRECFESRRRYLAHEERIGKSYRSPEYYDEEYYAAFAHHSRNVFARWHSPMPPETVFELLKSEQDLRTRALLFGLLERSKFEEQHIEELLKLAYTELGIHCAKPLRAIARIGGDKCWNALTKFAADWFQRNGLAQILGEVDPNLRTIIDAMVAAHSRTKAWDTLRQLLFMESEMESFTCDDDVRFRSEWNRMLVLLMSRNISVYRMEELFCFDSDLDEEELRLVATTAPMWELRIQATRTLVRCSIWHDPLFVLDALELCYDAKSKESHNLLIEPPTWQLDDHVPIGYWAARDIHILCRRIECSGDRAQIHRLASLCFREKLPMKAIIECIPFLRSNGVEIGAKLTESLIENAMWFETGGYIFSEPFLSAIRSVATEHFDEIFMKSLTRQCNDTPDARRVPQNAVLQELLVFRGCRFIDKLKGAPSGLAVVPLNETDAILTKLRSLLAHAQFSPR